MSKKTGDQKSRNSASKKFIAQSSDFQIQRSLTDVNWPFSLSLRPTRFTSRKLRPTFRSKWGSWWFNHPKAKKVAVYSTTLLTVFSALFVAQLWLAAGRIIDGGGGAVALNEDVDPSLLNKEGDGRVNLLLIGVGGQEHQGGDLSDSIMIASLDPATKEVAMLSFPRDLYMEIAGFGSAKINAAHAYGEQYDYPGGGPKLLADTLTTVFDIPIHYYLRVDFQGFKQAVDAVGGVDINVAKAINDTSFPNASLTGYEPFKLGAGQHHLNSEIALKYVRSRYGSSDFDRADRQQQLLIALKEKVLSTSTLLDPVRLNRLVGIAAGHVRTNLSIEDGLKYMELVKQVDTAKIVHSNLDSTEGNLLVSRVVDGSWVLAPNSGSYASIREYLRRLMPDGYIVREGAKVKIVNASGVSGLGKSTARLLKSYGYQISNVSDGQLRSETEVVDYTDNSKLYTLNYLRKRFHANIVRADRSTEQVEDIVITIGTNYEPTTN